MRTNIDHKLSTLVVTCLALIVFGATITFAQAPPPRANGKIAFTSTRDGNQEIYLMNPDGTGQVRLTNNPGTDSFPAFAPDGRKIAFVSQNAAGSFAIKLMNADGANQTELTPIAFDNSPFPWHAKFSLSWSPDGGKIAFQENGEIFTVNVDGGNRTNLTNHPASDIEPSWSADGSRIIFVSSRVFYLTLHMMNADGSDVRMLPSDGELWDMSPDSSPTGNKIAFIVHSELFLPILYTANTDGTNRQVFDGCGATGLCSTHRNKPKWSPAGSRIVFHIWEFFSNDAEIYVKNIDGSGLTQLTNTNGSNFQPSWQPLAPSACPNPIDCPEFFVRQHYSDFLNREPDAGGLAYWTNEITQCGADTACIHQRRIGVSAAFFVESEFQETGYFVYRLYRASYGNLPAPNQTRANITYNQFLDDRWSLVGNPNLEQAKQNLVNGWVQRSRFLNEYPLTLSNADFVNRLFDRAGLFPFTTERQAEINAMNTQGRTRAQVLRNVLELPPFRSREYNPAFVLMQYFGYLRRDPDQAGYDFWLNAVVNSQPNNYRGMVCAFLTATEYQLRFSNIVTRSNADCAP